MGPLITESSDAQAIAAARTDPEAFGVVFDRHFDAIHRYVCARVGADAGQEIAGEVFVRAFDARTRYDAKFSDARPWLYAIATNLVHRRRRDERRQLHAYARISEPRAQPAEDREADERIDARRLAPAAAAALAGLRAGDRDALLLHAWGELTYEQIASALDVPVGTVRSRIHRARTTLRNALTQETQP